MNFLTSASAKIADRQSQAMSISSIVAFSSTSNTDTSSTILPEISFTSFDTQRILSWIASVGDSSGGYDSLPKSPIVESSTSVEPKAKSGNFFYDENDCIVPPPRMERQNAQCGNCYSFDVLPRNKFYDEDDCIILPPPMVRQDAQGGDRYSVDFLPRNKFYDEDDCIIPPPRMERQNAQCGNCYSFDVLPRNKFYDEDDCLVLPPPMVRQDAQGGDRYSVDFLPRNKFYDENNCIVPPPRMERQNAQCGNCCSFDFLPGTEQSESAISPRLETQNSQPVGGSSALLSPRLEQQLRQSRFGPFFVMPPRLERQHAQCGNRCSVDSLRGNEQSESVTVAPTRLETQNSLPVGGSGALLSPRLEQQLRQSRFGPFFVMPPRLERQHARSGEGFGLVVSTSRVGRVSVAGRRLASGVSDSTGAGRAEGMRRRLEEERIADANFGQTPISPLDTLSPRMSSSRLSPPTTLRLNPMPVGLPAGSNSIMRSCSCAPSIPSPVRRDPSTKQAHLHLKRSFSEPQLQTRARTQPQMLF